MADKKKSWLNARVNDLIVDGTSTIEGGTEINGNLDVTGALDVGSNITINGMGGGSLYCSSFQPTGSGFSFNDFIFASRFLAPLSGLGYIYSSGSFEATGASPLVLNYPVGIAHFTGLPELIEGATTDLIITNNSIIANSKVVAGIYQTDVTPGSIITIKSVVCTLDTITITVINQIGATITAGADVSIWYEVKYNSVL